MMSVEGGILRKVFTLILLSTLLYATFLLTRSLAVLSDAVYSLVDAVFVFSLWLSVILVSREAVLSKTATRMVSLSIAILSFIIILSASLTLYSSLLALKWGYTVLRPEFVAASEIVFIFVLAYVYVSLREVALREDVRALISLSRDVERNIMASFLVILASLFSMAGLHTFDPLVAFLISTYVLYKSLSLSYYSIRSFLGFSDPVLLDALLYRVRSTGVKVIRAEVFGMGPYYYVELVVDASHLPDPWEKVEELLRRRVESLLPLTARVIIKSPGGGI